MKPIAILAASTLVVPHSVRPATLADKLKTGLVVECQITEDLRAPSPNVNGSLNWSVTAKLANTGREGLKLGDDMILMDTSPSGDYFGAYAVYHPTGTSGGAWGEDYYDRAHNYVIANHSQYWPDGSMAGFSDGGSHHMGKPPEYKAPKSACNTTLGPGEKADFTVSMQQGVWLKREQSSRLLLVLPEVESAAAAQAKSRCRIILTLKRSESAQNAWELRGKSIVAIETESLQRLLASSTADAAMRILALNWLAEVDKNAAAPLLQQTIKQAKVGDDFVASVQLLGYHGISPEAEVLQAIKTIAAGNNSWSQLAAARYLKEKVASHQGEVHAQGPAQGKGQPTATPEQPGSGTRPIVVMMDPKGHEDRCAAGQAEDCDDLARWYQADTDERDLHRAALYLEKACDAGRATDCTDLGLMYDNGRGVPHDPTKAAQFYRKGCDKGSPAGCTNLGVMYADGEGVPPDRAQAAQFYRKGCDAGSAQGCNNLGFMYANGQSVAQDNAKAIQLYQKACDGGYAAACNNVGAMYAKGQGVAQDNAKAAVLYQKACDGGNTTGCGNLGMLYFNGEGVAQDNAKAVALFQKACDGGDATGCYSLGVMYFKGRSVVQDKAKAAALFQKACDGGNATGCYNLAVICAKGEGVAQDKAKAVQLYQKACDGHDADGCYYLAVMYGNGDGVTQDKVKAAQLYQKACDGGNATGCYYLARMCANGDGVTQDKVRAAQLYQKACDGGAAPGCHNLAVMYSNGEGVAQDKAKAAALFQKACDAGNATACTSAVNSRATAASAAPTAPPSGPIVATATPASERYTADANDVVHDTTTGLDWLAGPDKVTTWAEAKRWVADLSVDGGGWRMPAKQELRGLYTKGLGTHSMTPLLKTTGSWVWSAAEAQGPTDRWGFSFDRDGELVMNGCAACNSRAFAVRKRVASRTGGRRSTGNNDAPVPPPQQACEKGDMQACFDLAFLHWDGKVTGWIEILKARDAVRRAMQIDSQRGRDLQRSSCEKGNARSCRMLAFIYGTGDAIPKDEAKEAQLNQKACNLGDAMACWSLGFFYAKRGGALQNTVQSQQLWRRACTAGYPGACNILGVVLGERDKVKAAALFEKACQGGWAEACNNLGISYRDGKGVAQDKAKAAQLFQKACAGGWADACDNLGQKQTAAVQERAERNKREGEAFLAANKTKERVATLPSGLQYKVLKEGDGKKPTATDTVICHYRGTLIDGTEFDSSYKRNQPVTTPVSGVIKGWSEALQLMPVGSKWQLVIPSDLAYGERGTPGPIGPNATLIFEVELLSIKDKS